MMYLFVVIVKEKFKPFPFCFCLEVLPRLMSLKERNRNNKTLFKGVLKVRNMGTTQIKYKGIQAKRTAHLYGYDIKSDVYREVNNILRESDQENARPDTVHYSQEFNILVAPLYKKLFKALHKDNTILEYETRTHAEYLKLLESLKNKVESDYTLKNVIQDVKNIIRAKQPSPKNSLVKGKTHIKVGMNLYTSWGYDQTNTELYKIVSILGNSYFLIQSRKGTLEETGFMCGTKKGSDELVESIPLKAYISPNGYMSICESGYKRGLYIEEKNQEHYTSWYA